MFKDFWTFVGILIVAIVLAITVWSFAQADYIIDEFANWEEVWVEENPDEIILVLKNPDLDETIFAMIKVSRECRCIPIYFLIGRDIRGFVKNKPAYTEFTLNKEVKKTIWTYLRVNCGIRTI